MRSDIDPSFVAKLRCPVCNGALDETQPELLRCKECERTVPAPDGIPDFLPSPVRRALDRDRAVSSGWRRWSDAQAALARWRAELPNDASERQRDRARLRRFWTFAHPSGDWLDVGCKDGAALELVPSDSEIRYIGVEPMPVRTPGIERPPIARAVGETLPFRDETFDGVSYLSSFDYVVDSSRALAEARRVLRPRGRLLMSVAVHPPAVAAALRARGLRAIAAGVRPGVARAIGKRRAVRTALDGLVPGRRLHTTYYSADEIEALVEGTFALQRREQDEEGVLFLEAGRR